VCFEKEGARPGISIVADDGDLDGRRRHAACNREKAPEAEWRGLQ
jgi:hypothetical protein